MERNRRIGENQRKEMGKIGEKKQPFRGVETIRVEQKAEENTIQQLLDTFISLHAYVHLSPCTPFLCSTVFIKTRLAKRNQGTRKRAHGHRLLAAKSSNLVVERCFHKLVALHVCCNVGKCFKAFAVFLSNEESQEVLSSRNKVVDCQLAMLTAR